MAVEGLNGTDIGDKRLKVSLASVGARQASDMEMSVTAMSMFAGTQSNDFEETRILQLLNMVTAEELIDNDEYEGKLALVNQASDVLTYTRNLRGHPRRMSEIRYNPGHEDPTTGWW